MQLSFVEPDLYSMYYDTGLHWPAEYSQAVQEQFAHVVNTLRDMPSVGCLLKGWRCLDVQVFNASFKLLSAKIDQTWRLVFGYNDTHDTLIICSLYRVAVLAQPVLS